MKLALKVCAEPADGCRYAGFRSTTQERPMNDRQRLEQLRTLVTRLERMPASPRRDWMLSEARGRTVDVESGVRTGPMRPLEAEAESAPPAPVEPKPTVAAG